MIETTVPEIDVAELMARVRAEAARPKPVVPRRPAPAASPIALPPVTLLPAAPHVWIPGAVKSNKERLDRLVETARQKNDGGSRLPKFLRRFFRKQGGYNRAIVDGVAALAKSNQDLTQRVADITVCLGQLNHWLLALHEQSDGDANWMKAAAAGFAKVSTLENELNSIGQQLQSAHATLHEVRREQSLASDKIDAVEAANQEIAGLRETVAQLRREIADATAQMVPAAQARSELEQQIQSLRPDLDKAVAHLGNLQAQADGISQQVAELQTRHSDRSDDLQHQIDHVGLHLRNLQAQTDRVGLHLNNLQGFVDKQTAEAEAIHHGLEQRLGDQAGLAQRLDAFEQRTTADAALVKGELSEYGALFRRLLEEDSQPAHGQKKKSDYDTKAGTKAAPGADSFYLALEDRFRGSRGEIKKRVEFYLPFIRKCGAGTVERPILDVGCGRGEWLELLKEHHLHCEGVDLNTTMVSHCKARGLKVHLRDAIEHLRSVRANTYGAVTGFHIIEHVPFETLLDLVRQTRRALKPGGVAIFESPNCKNILVGACTFHIDPTHRSPVFPETAELILASQGFEKIQIEYLSPVADVTFNANTPELGLIRDLLYGPQDFGVIGYKPSGR